jgi:hypothetical protein
MNAELCSGQVEAMADRLSAIALALQQPRVHGSAWACAAASAWSMIERMVRAQWPHSGRQPRHW